MRWLAVPAKEAALLSDVLAGQRTYVAQIFVNLVASVRMMRTHRTSMRQMMVMRRRRTMMVVIFNIIFVPELMSTCISVYV